MIIGISGLASSGKDTSADHLVRRHNFIKISFADPLKRIVKDVYNFTEDQLWGPSENRNAPDKRYLQKRHERHDWQEDPKSNQWRCCRCELLGEHATPDCQVYLSPRKALQTLGTEWARNCYENTWVDYALRTAKKILTPGAIKYHYTNIEGLTQAPRGTNLPAGIAIPDVRFKNEISALKANGAKVIRIRRQSAGLSGSSALHPSEQEQLSVPDSEFDAVIANNDSLESLFNKLSELVKGWGIEG